MKRAYLLLPLALLVGAACAPVKASGPARPDVILWGDSFGEQVAHYLPYRARVYGGISPCDIVADVKAVPAPRTAVLLFQGIHLAPVFPPPNCDYPKAVNDITISLESRGTRVLWLSPILNPAWPESWDILNSIYPNPVYEPTNSVGGSVYWPQYRGADGAHLNDVGAKRVADEIMRVVG